MKETNLQFTVCEYLKLKGHFFWRTNTTPIFNPVRNSFRRMPKYARSGVPDIILVKAGQFIGLEIKNEKGRQSESQLQFQLDLEKAGGKYHVIRSLQELR